MRRYALSLVLLVAPGGVLLADSADPNIRNLVSSDCLREITVLHGVWIDAGMYLPIYSDIETFAYLAGLSVKAAPGSGVTILPVYAADPIHVRLRNYVFLSTGLILAARDEQELLDVVHHELYSSRLRQTHKSRYPVSSCAEPLALAPEGLPATQARLTHQISQYRQWRTPRLQHRP